jgi:D-sedoheptulose 7-phosphate isomerase
MKDDIKKQIVETIETHKRLLAEFEKNGIEKIAAIAQTITKALKRKGTVYIFGNGGSAADAQHIASELVGRFARERKALAAVALSTDTSIITSVANDYTFENIFARQVQALVRKGDILWAFSTSGTSPNVIAAVKLGKKIGAKVIAFTGKPNSMLEELADVCFCVGDQLAERSQEIHQLAYHIICDLVEQNFVSS